MPVQTVARIIEQSRSPRLGLMTEGASLEYYLWDELGVNRGGAPYIVNLAPPAGFGAIPDVPPCPSSAPRWVVWLEGPSAPPMGLVIEGSFFERKRYWRWGHNALYRKRALRERSEDTRSESG